MSEDPEPERRLTPREKDAQRIDAILALIDDEIGPPPEPDDEAA